MDIAGIVWNYWTWQTGAGVGTKIELNKEQHYGGVLHTPPLCTSQASQAIC